jgi:hypothetical protein
LVTAHLPAAAEAVVDDPGRVAEGDFVLLWPGRVDLHFVLWRDAVELAVQDRGVRAVARAATIAAVPEIMSVRSRLLSGRGREIMSILHGWEGRG